jgi:hypothetical protein
MNEHQYNHISDINHNDYTSEQNLSPEITTDYNQDSLTNPTHTEQPWEQHNQTDYTQPNFNGTEDYNFYGATEIGIQNNSYGSDLSDLNNSYYDDQHLTSVYEQPDYGVGQDYYQNNLEPHDYNNVLLENSYGGDFDNYQRSGKMVTLNELGKDHNIGDIITEDGKDYKIVDFSPIHGGYDVIPVEHYPDGTHKEQGSTNTFLPKSDIDLDNKNI